MVLKLLMLLRFTEDCGWTPLKHTRNLLHNTRGRFAIVRLAARPSTLRQELFGLFETLK